MVYQNILIFLWRAGSRLAVASSSVLSAGAFLRTEGVFSLWYYLKQAQSCMCRVVVKCVSGFMGWSDELLRGLAGGWGTFLAFSVLCFLVHIPAGKKSSPGMSK